MGKRYYCDYCDASFPDGKEGRKKHNTGHIHLKMREAHFRKHGDARTRLALELEKGPCSRILQGLPCRFGEDCHFSHLQHHEIDQLRYTAMVEEFGQVKVPQQVRDLNFSTQIFIQKAEELSKIREAENYVSKLLDTTLELTDFDKIPLPSDEKELEDLETKQ